MGVKQRHTLVNYLLFVIQKWKYNNEKPEIRIYDLHNMHKRQTCQSASNGKWEIYRYQTEIVLRINSLSVKGISIENKHPIDCNAIPLLCRVSPIHSFAG